MAPSKAKEYIRRSIFARRISLYHLPPIPAGRRRDVKCWSDEQYPFHEYFADTAVGRPDDGRPARHRHLPALLPRDRPHLRRQPAAGAADAERLPVLLRLHDAVLRDAVRFLRPPAGDPVVAGAVHRGLDRRRDGAVNRRAAGVPAASPCATRHTSSTPIDGAIVQDRFSGAEAQKILSHIMM